MSHHPFRSVFSETFDIIIFGGGYAGFAAARQLAAQGRHVLLVEPSAAILWESGWGFSPDPGQSSEPLWQDFVKELQNSNAAAPGFIDGAIAEVVGCSHLGVSKIPALFYATPIAAWRDGDNLGAVAVGTKAGVRILAARQWIDATEEGQLLSILTPDWSAPIPSGQSIHLFYRHTAWSTSQPQSLQCPDLPGATLTWSPAHWPNQRLLTVDLAGNFPRPRSAWIPALRAVHAQFPENLAAAILSHGSVVPVRRYSASAPPAGLPANVIPAIPGASARAIQFLADRFEVGLAAARQLASHPQSSGSAAPFAFAADLTSLREESTQVAIAGAGTGGALAAIAAAREGAEVTAIEPLPYAGGIGAGGGIHWYYYGVKGGLQEEVDQRTREIMPLFGQTSQVQGFHPDAKKVIIDQLLHEAGVRLMTGATVYGVQKHDQAISAALIATPAGPVRLAAPVWVDSTGDGDLAAGAGASFWFGREADGQLHAYSQSSGRIGVKNDLPKMSVVNFDAGFVDPIDPEDQTRARLYGISIYQQDRYTELERPTYIAPAIGLRQSRHIETDYRVTLADLIERRTFSDVIGLTGAHYDNHAIDYEFETDEGMFWVWVCRQWRTQTACEMPYRMLIPRGLDNVLIACRAAGVTPDAHHSLRMQRDIQRLGEVAGIASALAVKHRVPVRQVPYEALKAKLLQTGALRLEPIPEDPFGPDTNATQFAEVEAGMARRVEGWLEELKAQTGPALFHLYRAEKSARSAVTGLLKSTDPAISWRAAAILAMWSDPIAEPRLRQAITSREYGFDPATDKDRPETNNWRAPNWLAAIALLRRCGTAACLPELHDLASDPGLLHNARTALAITIQALAMRLKLDASQKALVTESLRRLLSTLAPNAVGTPQRKTVGTPAVEKPELREKVVEDFTWQLHLAVAKAEQAAGLPVHPQAKLFLVDPRSLVRRAFAQVLQNY